MGIRNDHSSRLFACLLPAGLMVLAGLALPSASRAAAIQVSAGYDHSCALLQGGSVSCWGSNQYGQLGDGTTTPRTGPVVVSGITDAKRIVTGWQSSCALREDSTVSCWGHNDKGQLGDGTFVDRASPTPVSGVTGATEIASGWQHRCALIAAGAIKCWGRNDSRQLGITTRIFPFSENKPITVPGISGVTRLGLGFQHTCALRSSGTVACFGLNSSGQLGDGQAINLSAFSATPKTVVDGTGQLTGVTKLDSGLGNHSCAVTAAGAVRCWGMNTAGELGDGTTASSSSPRSAATSPGITTLALGWEHSCVVIGSTSIECWGWNRFGQLGDGSRSDRWTPTVVADLVAPTAVAGGFGHSCAIANGGRAYCWGRNLTGQLGDGTTTESARPVEVPNMVDPPRFGEQPAAATNTVDATFAFTGEPGASFECSTDAGPFESCTSPVSLTGLESGMHTFRVRQSNPIGTSNPAVAGWTIDRTAPAAPQLKSVPPSVTRSRTASVAFTGEPGASFSCSLDDGPDYPCSSPTTLKSLADGQRKMEVTQTDAAGNLGPTAVAIWTVDTIGPALTGKVVMGTSRGDTILRTTFDAALGAPAKLEWTTSRTKPAAGAKPVRGRVLPWAARLVVREVVGIRWVRVSDRLGNQSGWVRAG